MPVNFTDILKMVQGRELTKNHPGWLVLEYGALKQKLENPGQQSWAFKKGLESNQKKLTKLKTGFDRIREEFNSRSLDDLIEQRNYFASNLKRWKQKEYIYMNDRIAISSFAGSVQRFEQLIGIKKRITELKEMEFYLDNSEELIKLLDW